MSEERGLRVFSIETNIPKHTLTIVTEYKGNFQVSSDERIIVLSETELRKMDSEYRELFKKYRKDHEELSRYKCAMKELKLLMEANE